MSMVRVTFIYAALLVALGLGGYLLGGETPHWTALIPAFFGALFAGLGAVAMISDTARRHAMHAACVLALIGMGGPIMRIARTGLDTSPAKISMVLMILLSVAFLALCINSFIQARRRRAAG
jgi:hypothetical protein